MKLSFHSSLTAADAERRVIAGRLVTWDEIGHTSQGPTRFAQGSIELDDDVKLLREHDRSTPLGRATRITVLEDGIEASFRVAGTTAGSDALVEAAEQLRDGLSVGVEVLESEYDSDGTLVVLASRLDEVSLVHTPAISSARVDRVAASEASPEAEPEEGESMNPDESVEVEESAEAVEAVEASRPAIITRPRARVSFSGAGDYLATYIAANRGDSAAKQRIQAALAEQVIGDNPGIVPEPIVGDLVSKEYGMRPLKNSARNLPMPQHGSSFIRPLITQHTVVSSQAAEFTELASQDMKIDPVSVAKHTYGGALKISFQDRDWTDPAIMGIVTADLVRQYAEQTEAVLGVALTSGATGSETLAADAASDVVIKAVYNAAAKVNTAAGVLPDTMWASPDQWARLGSLVDGQKRPIFPTLAPSNAPGTASADSFSMNPLGLRLVVSSHLSAGTLIVGASRYFEVFENTGGALSATQPDVLGTTIAYYGYMSQLVTIGGALVKLAPVTK